MNGDQGIARTTKVAVARALRSRGYEVLNIDQSPQMQFHRDAQPGLERRARQTVDTVQTSAGP